MSLFIPLLLVARIFSTEDAVQDAGVVKLAQSLEAKTEELRGLRFRKPVKKGVKDKKGLRDYLLKEMAEEMPPEKLKLQSQIYQMIGLLPKDYDLEKGILDLLTDSVGGFYDPKTETLYLMEGMSSALQKIVIVHEMTHAIDDQYFRLQQMMDRVKNHEDKTFAVRAVVEGSGTLVMNRYQMQTPSLIAEMQKDQAQVMEMMRQQEEIMRKTPSYLVKSLAGAYIAGQVFLGKGEMSSISKPGEEADWLKAFTNPPRSSEQVLHPEKYWDSAKVDEPENVQIPDLSKTLGEGWKLVNEDTLGELNIAILTEDKDAAGEFNSLSMMTGSWTNDVASGWDGDRYVAYQKGEDFIVIWSLVWDQEKDAEEFEKAYQWPAFLPSKMKIRKGKNIVIGLGTGRSLDILKIAIQLIIK